MGNLRIEMLIIFKEVKGSQPSTFSMGDVLQLPVRFLLSNASAALTKLLHDNGFLFYKLLLVSLGLPDESHRDRLLKFQFEEHAGKKLLL